MEKTRLQKWMATCGVASRRHSEAIIAQGRVTVNGQVVREQGLQIDPEKDRVAVDGRVLEAPTSYAYYLYDKPEGLITTAHDPQGRPTIFDALPELRQQVVPVGRLDRDTSGLLLLTNDGELTYRLTHPSYHVNKRYEVTVKGFISDRALRQLVKGIDLEDGRTAPAEVQLLHRSQGKSKIALTIHEGRKRQVRRMCQAVGYPVLALRRTEVAGLGLSKIAEGEVRPLTAQEVQQLYQAVNMSLTARSKRRK